MKDELFSKLLGLDLKLKSITEIEEYLSASILGHSRPNINISPEGLFRARIITNVEESSLNTVNCIWYPDWSKIPPEKHIYGRCSDKGQNFFYSSNYLGATIRELKPQDSDKVLIGVFNLQNSQIKIRSQFAGINAIKETSQFKTLADYTYPSVFDQEIEELISSKFQEIILPTDSCKYKLTVAVTNILLKNDRFGCVIYPSVASNLSFMNYGFKPEYIDRYFYCSTLCRYSAKVRNTETILIPEKYAVITPYGNSTKNFKVDWVNYTEEEKKKLTLTILNS